MRVSKRQQRRERIAAVKAGHQGDGANRRRQARQDAAKCIEAMHKHNALVAEAEERMAQREADAALWMEERRGRGNSLLRLQMMALALGGLGAHR